MFVEPLYDLAGYKLAYSNSKKARKVSYHKLSLYVIRILSFYPFGDYYNVGPSDVNCFMNPRNTSSSF